MTSFAYSDTSEIHLHMYKPGHTTNLIMHIRDYHFSNFWQAPFFLPSFPPEKTEDIQLSFLLVKNFFCPDLLY